MHYILNLLSFHFINNIILQYTYADKCMYILIVLRILYICMYITHLFLITHLPTRAVQVAPLYNSKTLEVLVC